MQKVKEKKNRSLPKKQKGNALLRKQKKNISILRQTHADSPRSNKCRGLSFLLRCLKSKAAKRQRKPFQKRAQTELGLELISERWEC